MKVPIIIGAACLAQGIAAKYEVSINYTPTMVDVGNLDVFKVTWQKIYGSSGNTNSIISQENVWTQAEVCPLEKNAVNVNVGISMEGQWGRNPGLGPNDAREAIVQSLWGFLQTQMREYETQLWTDCWKYFPRGPNNPPWYPQRPVCAAQGCTGCGNMGSTLVCRTGSKGHRVPARIKLTMKNDQGQLMADGITVSFTANTSPTNNGCSSVLKTAGSLASFIPGVGGLFKAGLTLACDLGGA